MEEVVVAKLAEEAITGCVNQVKHQFQYLSQYHENMIKLEANVKNLEKKVVSVRDEVFLADSNAQTIKEGVNAWLTKVKYMKEDAEKILEMEASVGNGCWKGWCVNMRPRYRLSKKAMKKTVDLVMFIEEGVFDTVAHPKRHLGFVTSQIQQTTDEGNIQGVEVSENSTAQHHATKEEIIASAMLAAGVDERLDSRAILLNDVMEAVRDPQIRMVRICGMGGIGKTTMAKQVEQMARKERLFHEIAMVEVNQNPDVKLLQLHIAELLGLKITEDNVSARARWLGERLTGQHSEVPNKKILLILDNVWELIDLEKAGIPLKDANSCCKIVLTARNDDICKGLMLERGFSVEVLSHQEAMTLFHQSVSNNGGYYDETTSQDLVKECGGLPIAVATIAGAVKNKTEREWKSALRKLKNSDIRRNYATVFRCLKISYDFLEDEKIKKFFRLCCLFSKGSDVSIEELTRYGTALCLFNDPEYVCDAREDAFSYVQTLIHSNLFLRSDRAECLKVHDIVWDFAVSASSSDSFLVNHDSSLMKLPRKDSYEDFTSISVTCSNSFQVPESLSFPNLKLLQLKGDGEKCFVESLENFFKEMRGLCVLHISSMSISSTLMRSLQFGHLRSLSLTKCFFLGDDVSLIGKLSNLEILSFAHSDMKELPIDIKNLKSLRLLDLTMCKSCVIAPHVLSVLTSLEELYMREVPLRESVFVDIASMSTLVVIDIKIPENQVQLMNSLFKKLKKFKVFINAKKRKAEDEDQSENRLSICCDLSILLQNGLISLLQKATRMDLSITNLETLKPLNYSNSLDFSELKSLRLEDCADLVGLVNKTGNLEHNFVAPFRNLKVLNISRCDKLEYVLTVSVAKGLCNLETITIANCLSLNVIFWKESDNEGNIELPCLKNISLDGLDNLSGCYNIAGAVDFPRLQKVILNRLPLITSLVESETESLASGHNDASCSHPFFSHKEPDTVCRYPNLTSVKVKSCDRLRYIAKPSMANSFGEVQKLKVIECIEFQAIVTSKSRKEGDDQEDRTQELLFQKLNLLRLKDLKNLSTIVPKGYTLQWSSLKTLDVLDSEVEIPIQTTTIVEPQFLLTRLQNVTINGVRSLNLLSRLIPGGFSCKIRDMNVPDHDEVSFIFSPSFIRAYAHLKGIHINNLHSEVVFNLEEECSVGSEAEIAALDKLDSIEIAMLHKMTHIWRKVPKNFKGFHNLTFIQVEKCNSLRYLFSPSIAECLVKLQRIHVSNCGMIKEVISTADEGEKEVRKMSHGTVFFPQLQDLRLSYLPLLICINLEICDSEKHSTEAQNAGTTQMLHHDISSSSSSSILAPICTEKGNSMPLASIRTDGVRRSWSFHHLTQINVSVCRDMSTLFPPNIQVNLPVLIFLGVISCDKMRYIFNSNTTLRSLKRLAIFNCKMLEVIVKDDVEEGGGRARGKFVFPALKDVHIGLLQNLEGFCLDNSTFEWPSLTNMEISNCSKMNIFTRGCSTTPLLNHLSIDSTQHILAEGGGDINTTFAKALQKDVYSTNTELREQGILTRTGFLLAGDHLVAQCSSWHWGSIDQVHLIRKDVPCLERARTSNTTIPALETDIEIELEDTDNRPRKYDIIISHDNTSTSILLQGYDQQSDTSLPLKLVLQDIHESYSSQDMLMHLNPGKNSTSFIKDLFAREGVQPDYKNIFNIWLSALFPTMKCFDD